MNAKLTTEDMAVDKEEMEIAKKEAEKGTDVFTYSFKKPVSHNDEEVTEITFDWGGLTGADSLAIDAESRADNVLIAAQAFSEYYLVRMAVRANDKKAGMDFFERVPIKAYNAIMSSARSFLIRSES